MLRIHSQNRGGQGMKTVSRIATTASPCPTGYVYDQKHKYG